MVGVPAVPMVIHAALRVRDRSVMWCRKQHGAHQGQVQVLCIGLRLNHGCCQVLLSVGSATGAACHYVGQK